MPALRKLNNSSPLSRKTRGKSSANLPSKMVKKINGAQDEYRSLIAIRRKKLEKPLGKIDDIRLQRGILVDASLPES
jgi:hypothetical protein